MSKKLSFSSKLKNIKIWAKRIFISALIPFVIVYFFILDTNDTYYSRVSGPIIEISYKISNVIFYPIKMIKHGLNEISEMRHARFENRTLKQEIAELREIKLENQILKDENKRLSGLLKQLPHQTRSSIVANIIYDSQNSLHHTFIVTAGRELGVKPGMAVLSQNGELIAVISIVGKHFSKATSVTDLSSSIPVRVPGTEIQGFLKGNNSSRPIFELFNDSNFVPEVGMPIMTSGIYGTMPAGIPVGYVYKVSKNHAASIKLHSNLNSVYSVRIIPFDSLSEYKNAIKDLETSNETL